MNNEKFSQSSKKSEIVKQVKEGLLEMTEEKKEALLNNISVEGIQELPHNQKSVEQKIKEYKLGIRMDDFKDIYEAERCGWYGLRELCGGWNNDDEYYCIPRTGFIGKIRHNQLLDEYLGKLENLPLEAKYEILETWTTINESPFSNSLYNNREKTWHYTKPHTLRVSDHFLESERYESSSLKDNDEGWYLMEFIETLAPYNVQEIPVDYEETEDNINKYLEILQKYLAPLQKKYDNKFKFSKMTSFSGKIHNKIIFPNVDNILDEYLQIINNANLEIMDIYDEQLFGTEKGNSGHWKILKKYYSN